jgi:exodeoxyribonuclease V alpha subunit
MMEEGVLRAISHPGSASAYKTLSGVIERIVYQDEAASYMVARLQPEVATIDPQVALGGDQPAQWAVKGKDHLVTITGPLIGIMPGEALELLGAWQRHPDHGWHFQVSHYRSVLPATVQGIRKYLGSGFIQGIGPLTAAKVVARFGLETFTVLDQHPQRLREIPGLGPHKARRIATAWEEHKAIKAVLLCLQGVGISTSYAVKIYQQYGDAAVSVITHEPYRLAREVEGIGFKTADAIAQALGYARDHPERIKAGTLFVLSEATNREGHTYLPRLHLMKKASRLLEVSTEQVDEAIDELLLDQGLQIEVRTLQANGYHQLAPLLSSTWLASEDLTGDECCEERVSFDTGEAPDEARLEANITRRNSFLLREEAVSLLPFYYAERGVARHLLRLALSPAECGRLAELQQANFSDLFEHLATSESLLLAERQKEGITIALTFPFSIITGGPGTGKTTSLRALIRLLMLKHKQVVLAAPTGRAAKRLSQATGIEAKTLHRLLQLRPDARSPYDQANPLLADMVVVDEASMLDILLMNTLLKAIATGTHLLLVGDADQLPSIGPGKVLADIIASQVAPVVQLETIYRQGAGSGIATNARRMKQGQMPRVGPEISDFFLFSQDDLALISQLVVDLVAKRIPSKLGFRSEEIQVLAPMHRGRCGVDELNRRLQEALNPPSRQKAEKPYGGMLFRVGDKVLQVRNNYDKEVFNGDVGSIIAIDLEEQCLIVQGEEGREVRYRWNELDELTLAYAMSIHKSQGSEYPVCVIPLAKEQHPLLQRRVLYTAVTRARQLVVLVGSKEALSLGISNGIEDELLEAANIAREAHNPPLSVQRGERYTGLAIRLRQYKGSQNS